MVREAAEFVAQATLGMLRLKGRGSGSWVYLLDQILHPLPSTYDGPWRNQAFLVVTVRLQQPSDTQSSCRRVVNALSPRVR